MQTFLPLYTYADCAAVLDNKRLGKQRVECKQILKALRGEYDKTGAWVNHPATNMWRGYEYQLCLYSIEVCVEWRSRGFQDTLLPYFVNALPFKKTPVPHWLGDEKVHASHRSNLLRKDSLYYGQYYWSESDDLPYYWPNGLQQ